MAEAATADALGAECRLLTIYLMGAEPPPDIVAAYVRAHQFPGIESRRDARARDQALLRIARIGPRWTRAADAYAAMFARGSSLRRKLVLLVAILESRAETATVLDTATGVSSVAWMLTVALHGAACVVRIAVVGVLLAFLRLQHRMVAIRKES